MYYSKLLIPTLKESPADAEVVSHKLMVRAGMIRQMAAGIYSILPLGLRVFRKVEQIIREEMNQIGGQEVSFPASNQRNCGPKVDAGIFMERNYYASKTGMTANFAMGQLTKKLLQT